MGVITRAFSVIAIVLGSIGSGLVLAEQGISWYTSSIVALSVLCAGGGTVIKVEGDSESEN